MTAPLPGLRSVLVVCTGNVCRSPFAEAVLRGRVPGYTIHSAGLAAEPGQPALDLWQDRAARVGLDLSAARARGLTPQMALAADLLLCMEAAQADLIVARTGALAGRVFLLTHWSGGTDIEDPILGSADRHDRIFAQVWQASLAWARALTEQVRW